MAVRPHPIFHWEDEDETFEEAEKHYYHQCKRWVAEQQHLLVQFREQEEQRRQAEQLRQSQEREARDRLAVEMSYQLMVVDQLDQWMITSIITEITPVILDPVLSLLVPTEEMILIRHASPQQTRRKRY